MAGRLSLCGAIGLLLLGCGARDRDRATPVVLAVRDSAEIGRYVTDTDGRPLYALAVDSKGVSTCIDDCARDWPPVPATEPPPSPTEPAIQHALIETITRPGGERQLAYGGLPLYYRASASAAVERAVSDRWGTWTLVFPHGERMLP